VTRISPSYSSRTTASPLYDSTRFVMFGRPPRSPLFPYTTLFRHALAPPREFQVVGDAARMHGLQARQQRLEVAVAFVRDGSDARPRQGVVVRALAELVGVHAQRVGDVRHHALVLGAAALDAEKLGDGQLHMAEARAFGGRPAVQVDQVLHRALAEGGLADDQGAAVVLHRAGEDLRSRGRGAVDQYRQRAVPGHARV